MKTSAKRNVSQFVNLCAQLGLRQIVVSPGSRNAPLSIAFNQHPQIHCEVVPDERSAAFVALGKALQRNEPVAVLCTSGSASANYYPAVVEAYYQSVPLIVISADRPEAWVNEGDGQTIMQSNLFGGHVRHFVQLADQPETESYAWYLRRETSKAFQESQGTQPGPVHLNFALSEPLYGMVEQEAVEQRRILLVKPQMQLAQQEERHVHQLWQQSERKLILCGQMSPNSQLKTELSRLAQDPSVLVLVENTSNLQDEAFAHCIDRSLNAIRENEQETFAPDLLITIGGAVVSKRIKTYLRKFQPKEHWKLGSGFPMMDTYQCLTHAFPMPPESFLKGLHANTHSGSDYGQQWKLRDKAVQQKAALYFENHKEWCDLTVFDTILKHIPESSTLHLANSSVVRYAQLFDPIPAVVYHSNRGASGIDGSTSTALGAASEDPERIHTLITGDMSFFYDSNAFWNHIKVPNLRVIVIHNGGGGIFKIIPGPSGTEELDDFFVFNNSFGAEALCKTFGLNYVRVESQDELRARFDEFYRKQETGRPKVMEIMTRDIANEQQLADYFEHLKW